MSLTKDLRNPEIDADRFEPDPEADALLRGAVDLHQHPGPSPFPRRMDIADAARDAAGAGFRAIVVKSHHQSMVTDILALEPEVLSAIPIEVYGGIALNHTVGGLNPYAVELALQMGGRVVWFPTLASPAHIDHHAHTTTNFPVSQVQLRDNPPIHIADDEGRLVPAAREVLDVIAAEDAVLTCGHLGVADTDLLITAAQEAGVRRIVVNHPVFVVGASVEQAVEWSRRGVYIEHCLSMYFGLPERRRDIEELARFVDAVGPEQTLFSSDSGQKVNPLPVTLFRRAVRAFLDRGTTEEDLTRLVSTNAAGVLL
jgi:hypothetical protein